MNKPDNISPVDPSWTLLLSLYSSCSQRWPALISSKRPLPGGSSTLFTFSCIRDFIQALPLKLLLPRGSFEPPMERANVVQNTEHESRNKKSRKSLLTNVAKKPSRLKNVPAACKATAPCSAMRTTGSEAPASCQSDVEAGTNFGPRKSRPRGANGQLSVV